MKNIIVTQIGQDQIMSFWEDSPQASVFTNPYVLSCLSHCVDWWLVKKGMQTLCLWPVCFNESSEIGLPNFTYHVGPMWSRFGSMVPAHRSLAMETAVYEGFIEEFLMRYRSIKASLPIGLHDIRVFDWWNYHALDKPRFIIRPRYTARIEGLQTLKIEDIAMRFREVRRQEIRRIVHNGSPQRCFNFELEEIIALYNATLAKQEIRVKSSTYMAIAALVSLVRDGHGEIVAYRDKVSGRLTYVALLLYGKGVANLVLSLVDEVARKTGLPAFAIHESICAAHRNGCNAFDFNGANSPARGDDKHSYGAGPELYFELEFNHHDGQSPRPGR